MSSSVRFTSILFERPADAAEQAGTSFFTDLNLDQATGAGIRIIFVTHLYDLAERCHAQNTGGALFLRAERRSDRRRTFRLLEGEPLPTSYGQDLYQQVFGTAYETAHA